MVCEARAGAIAEGLKLVKHFQHKCRDLGLDSQTHIELDALRTSAWDLMAPRTGVRWEIETGEALGLAWCRHWHGGTTKRPWPKQGEHRVECVR